MSVKTATIDLDGKQIIIETGLFGAQAAGAVTARCGDTVVLATVVFGSPKAGLDYFPLTVEYREKLYAGGVISSSRFIKREGRPSDSEILTSRLIDRSIRPLFPNNYFDEVQVMVSPLSIDGVNEPEILAIIASSAALAISEVPWAGPVGAVRIALDQDGGFIVNPTSENKVASKLDLVVSGGKGSIAMVEAGANEVDEKVILSALNFAQGHVDAIIGTLQDFASEIGKQKITVAADKPDQKMLDIVNDKVNVAELLKDSKSIQGEGIKLSAIADSIIANFPDLDKTKLVRVLDDHVKSFIRKQVLSKKVRFDGRKPEDIRTINAAVGVLPRTHGTGFFQRGLTHALSIVTLGSPADEQLIDGMKGEETKRYFHHYNMPGFATGEPGKIGNPGRREIGHGALAERALMPVIPSKEEFPYTIRVVSEIMSSNGSTSQASVCGSTLALMDAGVPIKKPVAGIAMGLITDNQTSVTLSDIAGLEDHIGDMDFKVAGTKDGVTAIQMDVKVPGVTADTLGKALDQAKAGRLFILDKMLLAISEPRSTVSLYAPKVATVKIPTEKIGELIGPGGKMIRQIQTDYSVEVNVDESGFVTVTGPDQQKVDGAKTFISGLTAEAEVGKIYQGTVTRVEPYGAFVEVLPGKDGLVHVSRMSTNFVNDANDLLKVGDVVEVKCYEVDPQGRINLTMLLNDEKPAERSGSRDGGRGNDRRPQSGGNRSFSRFRDQR